MNLECNDLFFRVAINKMDLLGEPSPGRRFKGLDLDAGNSKF